MQAASVNECSGGMTTGRREVSIPKHHRPRLGYTERMGTIDIANLSLEQRLRLLDELWESLSQTADAIPLTSAQREELDRRLNDLERESPVGIPWEDVLRQVRRRAQ